MSSNTAIAANTAAVSHLLDVYPYLPFKPDTAEGVYLCAGQRKLIDFYGGHAVAGLGYGHPDVIRTLETQAHKLFFQGNAVALAYVERHGVALEEEPVRLGLQRADDVRVAVAEPGDGVAAVEIDDLRLPGQR